MPDTLENNNFQRQTVLNLYNSGITPEIIAIQLDISEEEVMKVIESVRAEEEERKASARQASAASSLGSFYIDAVIDIESEIKKAQARVWKALRVESEFSISHEQTRNILEKFAKSKATLVYSSPPIRLAILTKESSYSIDRIYNGLFRSFF